MKLKKLFSNINTGKRLALINTLIFLVISSVLYFTLPYVLNYPPNSIDNNFQLKIVGIKYTNQFLILISILTLLLYLALRKVYSKLSTNNFEYTSDSNKCINNIRKKSFNYPYLMLVFEIFIPAIIVALLLFLFNTELELILRITTVVFSFSAVFAIFSYMINKPFFVNKLIQTSSLVENKTNGIRLNLYKKLIVQILPLFLYSFVLLLLLTIAFMTTEKGNLLYHFYRQELVKTFPSDNIYELSEVYNRLQSIDLKSNDDSFVIISADDGNVYYSEKELNNFFITYTLEYYDKTDGHTYEYYGQNIEGAIVKIDTNDGQYYVGIRYFVFANGFITPFLFMAIILIIFNVLFIFYIRKRSK